MYCAVHCSKQRNKAKQSKPKPNIILNPQYVCSLSIQQPRPARVSNLFLSGRYHVGTVKEQSQGKIDPGERSEMAFIQPGKKAVSSAILYLQDQGSSYKVSDQKGRMEIYLPQANVVCNQINFSWSNTHQFISLKCKYSFVYNHVSLFHSILAFYY